MEISKHFRRNGVPAHVIDGLGSSFTAKEMRSLGKLGTLIEVEKGRRLTIQGQIGAEAFVVVNGRADVSRDGKAVATICAGAVVGEVSLLTGARRNADIVARTDMSIFALSPREFSSMLTQCPELSKRVHFAAVARAAA